MIIRLGQFGSLTQHSVQGCFFKIHELSLKQIYGEMKTEEISTLKGFECWVLTNIIFLRTKVSFFQVLLIIAQLQYIRHSAQHVA